jgi:D-alanyl-D-alanine carboxypeptidase
MVTAFPVFQEHGLNGPNYASMGVQGVEAVRLGKFGKVDLMRIWALRVLKPLTIAIMAVALLLTSIMSAEAAVKFSTIVVDARTGALLSSDDPDGYRHPASLTKMMTLYLLFQDLKSGRVKLSTNLKVSRRAAAMAPSKLGLKAGSTITVEQAIKALVIKSANDAAATVGENLAGGSESAFANRMTRVARQIGMRRTTFKNASGLPNPSQVTTARDMATLGLRLMRDFPQYYPYFRSTSFVFKGRLIQGHNRLVGRFPGTDGIKTGYVNASGFNLVTSTKRGDKRVVGVVMGGRSSGTRNAHMMTIIARAFPHAQAGNTIAALAGSSKGAINPIAKGKLRQPVETDVAATEPVTDEDKDLLAAVAAEAAVTTKEEEDEAEAADTAADEPKVLEAELVDKPRNPKRLPFAVKPASDKTEELTVASLPDSYSVQIGLFKSKKDAQTGLGNIRAAVGSDMKNKNAYTISVKKGGRLSYKVMISGFSEVIAKKSCAKASKMGKACTVLNPAG